MTFQFGKLAQAATQSLFARIGDTCVLVTVVEGPERADLDYFPLHVEYVEKLYAGGRIKGSRWVKREGKPSDDAVLIGRLIDRSIRPLFPKSYKREVQVVVTLMSVDGVNSPEILASIAVSAALACSPIPWKGPISTSRIGFVRENGEKGEFVVNPTEENQEFSALDLIVSSTKSKVMMIETAASEIDEQKLNVGIEKALQENKKVIEFIESLAKELNITKLEAVEPEYKEQVRKVIREKFSKELDEILEPDNFQKRRGEMISELVNQISESLNEKVEKKNISGVVESEMFERIRANTLKNKKRIDGRGVDEIRDITVETNILPRTHGSAIFARGETQVLTIATLGSPRLEQLIEGPEGEEAKRYIHHYYMPPYSVGEVGRMGWPSRREIGHGALAEKALIPVLPDDDKFPYAIRVVSEIMSSNGSTSMASTCGSSLALMDAGVPIKAAVAGISIGLIYKSDDQYLLLTDIAGIEDFAGHMDFKVAGTEKGITAIQLDVKNDGLTLQMIRETFEKAKKARMFLLDKMSGIIKKPKGEVSKYAPKVVMLTPPEDKIGEIIGPGGKNIRRISTLTQTDINISDDGKVTVAGIDREGVDKAVELVKNVYRVVNPGEEFDGEVKRILAFGAFVEYLPGKEGLVHVSKMSRQFVKDPNQVVKIGQRVHVKVQEIDSQGRVNLTMV